MEYIINFIQENYTYILFIFIIIIIVFGLLIFINIKGINLNPPKTNSKLIQEVTVETFTEHSFTDTEENLEKLQLQPSESFCKSYLGNSSQLEPACNQLTETNCSQTNCCVYINKGKNGKCVAGDIHGPTYKTDNNGTLITLDTYYYLGKQY
jgi:cytoskeletal protein RodZ